ncbi:MAG: hypothetical protein AVDCRST_MAG59-3004 [uncultured Thermomicrobiales bacterium]|jgi:hypothetical protein|uniref:SnoaL-like domain-containing protein n=1 Tax=uncultured Thermomicrobiales bacterium TaxID=1645740 RepID=A0A6J4V579_9BACT|nr:MAG: hypothetical protein AVDCRST_MAG59-3004 [uncultured Thermomicrobiales bacterium]
MRHRFVMAVVPAAALLLSPGAMAQESTPDAEGSRAAAEACQGEARSVDELLAAVDLEESVDVGTPEAVARGILAPLGARAEVEAREGIAATVQELYACLNANDVPRAAALMTDAGLRRFLGEPPADEEAAAALRETYEAEPEARAEDQQARIVAITDESLLEDGRAVAFVVVNEPLLPPGGAETLVFYFVEEDGTWLLDDYIDFSLTPVEVVAGATPEAE